MPVGFLFWARGRGGRLLFALKSVVRELHAVERLEEACGSN